MMDDVLLWLQNEWRTWARDRKTGWLGLRLNFRHGEVKHHEKEQTVVETAAKPNGPRQAWPPVCPKCDRPMHEGDYGNAFTCEPCGVKRTRTQIAREAR